MKRLFILSLAAVAALAASVGPSFAQAANDDASKARKYVDKASPNLMKQSGGKKPTPLERHIETGIKGQRGLPDAGGQPSNKQGPK
ncbi:MAG: hypothetical protein HYR72_25120 [Deltaproteobacteria bacterium]|nr:hypothetical protein [Deltaproteobacteria bacterium]MBI3388508.1 hypothetical protein [Deltaproteobacteria bacterium]